VLGLGLGMVGAARGWLRVGQAFGVATWVGVGSRSSPQVPGHPTSMCDAGVNGKNNLILMLHPFH